MCSGKRSLRWKMFFSSGMLNSKLLTEHPQCLGGGGCGLRSVLDVYTITAVPPGWPETLAWRLAHRMRVPGLGSSLGSATCWLCGPGQVTAVPSAGVSTPPCRTGMMCGTMNAKGLNISSPSAQASWHCHNCGSISGDENCLQWPEKTTHWGNDHLKPVYI